MQKYLAKYIVILSDRLTGQLIGTWRLQSRKTLAKQYWLKQEQLHVWGIKFKYQVLVHTQRLLGQADGNKQYLLKQDQLHVWGMKFKYQVFVTVTVTVTVILLINRAHPEATGPGWWQQTKTEPKKSHPSGRSALNHYDFISLKITAAFTFLRSFVVFMKVTWAVTVTVTLAVAVTVSVTILIINVVCMRTFQKISNSHDVNSMMHLFWKVSNARSMMLYVIQQQGCCMTEDTM
jgi:hypothetical protein